MKLAYILSAALTFQSAVCAQVVTRIVRADGEATLSVRPDQFKINIGVTTQAATAQEAAALNASQMDAMLTRLKQALGAAGETRTIGYSITPNYRYVQGQPPVLTGYTATNTVEAATSELGAAGRIIDAAAQAGANSIGSLQFTLKDQEPARAQALSAAARQARAHAEAIASGLGLRVGAVRSAQEGVTVTPIPVDSRGTATTTPSTPVETGFVTVRATVTVDMDLTQ